MPKDLTLAGLKRIFRDHRRFLLTTHSNPDADGLGSELALRRFLTRRGKECRIVNVSATPRNLQFLCRNGDIEIYDARRHARAIREAEVIAAIDVGSVEKVDAMKEAILQSPAKKLLIDHHVKRDQTFDLHWVREDVSSSGEMVYDILMAIDSKGVSADVAQPILTAIIHDTGNFNYDRTTARTFRIAADLVARGARPYEIFKRKQCSRDAGQVRLIGEALCNVKLSPSGRVAWSVITRAMLRRHRIEVENLPRVIDQILTLASVEVAAVFTETASGKVKVSLRSKDYVDVSDIAHTWGGGGHRRSAGLTMPGRVVRVARMIVAKLEAAARARRAR